MSGGLEACPPGKLLKVGAFRLYLEQILHDMPRKLFSTRLMNHMMTHHNYIHYTVCHNHQAML